MSSGVLARIARPVATAGARRRLWPSGAPSGINPADATISAARAVTTLKPGSKITRGRIELAAGTCHRALGEDSEAEESFALAHSLLEPLLGAGNHWVRAAQAP